MKVFKRAETEWASLFVIVPKKWNLTVLRRVPQTQWSNHRDLHPLPRLKELFDCHGEAMIFPIPDGNSSYRQNEVHESDCIKTEFTSFHGLIGFTKMLFGLRNATATFQHRMDVIQSTVMWKYALVYIDDVLIFQITADEQIVHTRIVLRLLSNAAVAPEFHKQAFVTTKTDYLGHIIRPAWLKVNNRTVGAIRPLKTPITVPDLRLFSGICNVCRRFVPKFGRITVPILRYL